MSLLAPKNARLDRTRDDEHRSHGWIRRNTSWLVLAGALGVIVLPRLVPYEPLSDYLNVFERLSEWVLRKLEALFDDYGYYVVFFGVLAENSMFLGLLVPGAIILILAGLSAQNGSIDFWWVLALGISATIIGDTISYLVGRAGWTTVFDRAGMRKTIDRVRGPMESNRRWIVLAYHFAGYSRVVGPAASGLFGIPYRKWAPLDYAGATLWVLTYVLFGVVLGLFGLDFNDTGRMARLLEMAFTGLLVVAIVVVLVRAVRSRSAGRGDPTAAQQPAAAIIPVDEE